MSKQSFPDLLKQSPVPVLVDFHADWCGPCKAMAPVLEEIASRHQGKLKVIKIDTDKNPSASQAYQIQGIPTLLLFKNGVVKWRRSGALSRAELERELGPFIK